MCLFFGTGFFLPKVRSLSFLTLYGKSEVTFWINVDLGDNYHSCNNMVFKMGTIKTNSEFDMCLGYRFLACSLIKSK